MSSRGVLTYVPFGDSGCLSSAAVPSPFLVPGVLEPVQPLHEHLYQLVLREGAGVGPGVWGRNCLNQQCHQEETEVPGDQQPRQAGGVLPRAPRGGGIPGLWKLRAVDVGLELCRSCPYRYLLRYSSPLITVSPSENSWLVLGKWTGKVGSVVT